MITREDRAPYDRPNLSKDYLQGHAEPEWMPLRRKSSSTSTTSTAVNREVSRVDARAKTITFEGGDTMDYDALLVATGGAPVRLNIPGSDLKNVCVLRSFSDADSIIETAAKRSRACVVVVGASFIAMEAAYSLRARGLEVTVVAPSHEPFRGHARPGDRRAVPACARGARRSFQARFDRLSLRGQRQRRGRHARQWRAIETDMVVVGVGVRPVTHFLEGVELDEDGGVIVDSRLRAADGLYAAGDIASFPDPRTGERVRIEHWRTAQQQGRVAARNMAGTRRGLRRRSLLLDAAVRRWAALRRPRHVVGRDHLPRRRRSQDFLAFYVKDNRVLAVAGMNRDREMAALEELLRLIVCRRRKNSSGTT
jgi:NADPH-dependent 2,4-dienoyl-CoA reductase/sulfur reductase-like enzyme